MTLMQKAAGLALAAVTMTTSQLHVQPTIWTVGTDTPPQVNVFYDGDATRSAHRWQASHWPQFAASIMTSDGGITIDGIYQRALIFTTRTRARGDAEMEYVLPYKSQGMHLMLYPIMAIVHGDCSYLSSDAAAQIFANLQREVDSYEIVNLSFENPLPAQDLACTKVRSV